MVSKKTSLTRTIMLSCIMPALVACLVTACNSGQASIDHSTPVASPRIRKVLDGAMEQTRCTRYYDPAYARIAYPGGDVPPDRGVCSDVVVRAFRKAGVDLQKEVHEDMVRNFSRYPRKWDLKKPDSNIDHRRVANLMTFFTRKGKSVTITRDKEDYLPGDVVAWRFDNGLLHVGLVTNLVSGGTRQNLIIHNVGAGARIEDVLFEWKIIGHYRYF